MGRKPKISYEEKVKACEAYLNGTSGITALSQSLHVSKMSIWIWIRKFRSIGIEALKPTKTNRAYTKDCKIQVVEDYLNGKGSLESICSQYQIPSQTTVRKWIKKYNNLEELKDYDPKPEVYTKMASRKKTTKEERISIVNYCIEHENDYKMTASIYDVSYCQVYNWVKNYRNKGEDGLADGRGKRKKYSELTELERLQRENKILLNKLHEEEMKVELLKKLEEVEGRRYSPKENKKRNT